MAKFSETAFVVMLAIALSAVTSLPTHIQQSEAENEVDTGDISIAATSNDAESAPPAEPLAEVVDSNCDCKDQEALYHKLIRQLIDSDQIKNKGEFLKEFPIKKICGSDGKFYSTECHLQCTRITQPGHEDLHRTNRGICKRMGKGRTVKGRVGKFRSHHQHPDSEKVARMQRPEKEPETLVCICPRNYFPVCASNGITYGNRCAFECAKDNVDKDLEVVTLGEKCKEDDKTVL